MNVSDIRFGWIPYNQFSNIIEIGKSGFATVYSAIWRDGSLYYDNAQNCNVCRNAKPSLNGSNRVRESEGWILQFPSIKSVSTYFSPLGLHVKKIKKSTVYGNI